MSPSLRPPTAPSAGANLVANLMHFARLLRAAGLPVGPGRVIDAVRALETVGVYRRDDVYWALHAVFVMRSDYRELFDQAFRMFWRDPHGPEDVLAMMAPKVNVPYEERPPAAARRLTDHWPPRRAPAQPPRVDRQQPLELDLFMSYSEREQLRRKDFEDMSADELRRVKALLERMQLPLPEVPTRRGRSDPRGARVDMRATLRASLRGGGRSIPLKWRSPRRRPPPLVILCDISGSMQRYTRVLLHFMHAVTNDRDRVHSFVFGTRLTNATRHLRHRDVDDALSRLGDAAQDWDGGTRIGSCLEAFNRHWSRRVLGQGAVVLLITDGLDRDAGHGLEKEMERLRKSCRRLIWLNPLLRFEGFEPKATGIRAILPYVDDFRPVHNLKSIEELALALGSVTVRTAPGPRRDPRGGI